ncbi:MAG: hypothetical protein P8L66_07615 [Rhodospirillaceae bacterium]|nr:hypothetical protein [Rhodospirillaceae bacterium]
MSSAKYRRIAVIPARRGSSRLKRKALIEFNGTPLIAHTILAALDSKCFEKVVTSSATTAPVLINVLEH